MHRITLIIIIIMHITIEAGLDTASIPVASSVACTLFETADPS